MFLFIITLLVLFAYFLIYLVELWKFFNLDTKLLSYQIYDLQIFSLYVDCLFNFLMMSFEVQVLSFVGVQFICSFVVVSFVWNLTIHCQILRSWIFISIFSSNTFIVLALTFSLLLHFDLMVWSRGSNCSWLIIYPSTICCRYYFFSFEWS